MTRYRIQIKREACVGDQLCTQIAPNTFEIDKENKSVISRQAGDPPEVIFEAARQCRLEAISLYDADTGRKIWP